MCDLVRISELRNLVRNPEAGDAYFRNFDKSLEENPIKKKHFVDIERDLAGLDSAAWAYLKAELEPLLELKHRTRGWQALFDKLNQAKAYNYLVSIGCSNVAFIPESRIRGQKTPDLRGRIVGREVFCEVKTFNVSEVEAAARTYGNARSIVVELPNEFFKKLQYDLNRAKDQLDSYCQADMPRKMIYLVFNFDDLFHEHAEGYSAQIDAFVGRIDIRGLEVITDIKSPFYSAMA